MKADAICAIGGIAGQDMGSIHRCHASAESAAPAGWAVPGHAAVPKLSIDEMREWAEKYHITANPTLITGLFKVQQEFKYW
jgi:hypothetical protein